MDLKALDYAKTLEMLAAWEGRDVIVLSHSQLPGDRGSHSQVSLRGQLGRLGMVENLIHSDSDSVATFDVGAPPNAIYIDPGDFVHTMLLSEGHINIRFKHNFHIEVQLYD
jgi:hypothetical protein